MTVMACGTEQTVGAGTPVLRAACGSVMFDSVPADPSSFPPWDEAADPLDLGRLGPEDRAFLDGHDWSVAFRNDTELTMFGVLRDPSVIEGPDLAHAKFVREGDAWILIGWGTCHIQISAPGWGPAAFVLAPTAEPDPAATTISILAWEQACASGKAPHGRQVRPVVMAADQTSVSIVVLVEQQRTGDSTCQPNPAFPLQIDLGSPLGQRTIFDASVQPELVRPWPPTAASLDSDGRTE